MSKDFMKEAAGKIQGTCGSCNKQFPFLELKKYKINKKEVFACQDCIDNEKERLKKQRELAKQKREEKERTQPRGGLDPDFLKDLISDVAMKVRDEVTEQIHDELNDSVIVPRHPCIEGVFLKLIDKQEIKPYEFDKWRHLYLEETRKILLNLWFEDILRKTKNGWYMLNPEKITYDAFVNLIGYWNKYRDLTKEEYDSLIENTIDRSKKNPPEAFNTPGTERKNKMRQELFLENYNEEITGRIRELMG